MSASELEEFDIGFAGVLSESSLAIGSIQIGDHVERFEADLSYWSVERYIRSWLASLEELDSSDDSCLISSITDPRDSNFCQCWPLYKTGEVVFVQHMLIFFEHLDHPFDPEMPWRSVPPRVTTNEDGQQVSEFQVSISAVHRLRSKLSSI